MYGPPGCGKTMLAKAVAAHTTASFIRVVGSEFVQKYLGEGTFFSFINTHNRHNLRNYFYKYQIDYASIWFFASRSTHGT